MTYVATRGRPKRLFLCSPKRVVKVADRERSCRHGFGAAGSARTERGRRLLTFVTSVCLSTRLIIWISACMHKLLTPEIFGEALVCLFAVAFTVTMILAVTVTMIVTVNVTLNCGHAAQGHADPKGDQTKASEVARSIAGKYARP